MSIDVFDMHAATYDEVQRPDQPGRSYREFMTGLLDTVEERFPTGTRVYPPIVAGDFNASHGDMINEVAPSGILSTFEIASFTPVTTGHDVMGVLVGETGEYPTRFSPSFTDEHLMLEASPGSCGPVEQRWSDHCAVYVTLLPPESRG